MQAPAFDKIKNSDFKPAILEGIRQQHIEIEKIANNPVAPTFENTVVAIEKTGQLLDRASSVLSLLTATNINPELQKVQTEVAPLSAEASDVIYLNTKLYKRVEAIYKKRAQLKSDEARKLVETYHRDFLTAGADLAEADKRKLSLLNREEASLNTKFAQQLLAATLDGGLLIDDKALLNGLTETEIQALAQNAKDAKQDGKWLISLKSSTQQPYFRSLTNRAIRQKLYEASWTRTQKGDDNDTRATIARLAQLRAQKAKLLGFSTFSAWKLQDQMLKTTAKVERFLNEMTPAAIVKAKQELSDIQKIIDQQNGGFKAQAWDWDFYAEQVRKEKFDLDENELKPYLELNTVLEKGVFYAANLLYGMTFKERKDLPVYHPDVRVFDVLDKDGTQLALFYCDYFRRSNKRGGAFTSLTTGQSKLIGNRPVIYNIASFQAPQPGQPALLTFDQVRAIFHEFGHALHASFSNQRYQTLTAMNIARDFVEFPSQFNEFWAYDPKVLNNYAVHYQTRQPMPAELIEKLKKAETFNQGYTTLDALADDYLDLQWHKLTADEGLVNDIDKFEADATHRAGIDIPQVPLRFRSTYFSHIWNTGYPSGFYSYLWTSVMANDAYYWFKENGGLTRKNGQRFRDMILTPGNSIPLDKMFRNFRGREPSVEPMMLRRGLVKQ